MRHITWKRSPLCHSFSSVSLKPYPHLRCFVRFQLQSSPPRLPIMSIVLKKKSFKQGVRGIINFCLFSSLFLDFEYIFQLVILQPFHWNLFSLFPSRTACLTMIWEMQWKFNRNKMKEILVYKMNSNDSISKKFGNYIRLLKNI